MTKKFAHYKNGLFDSRVEHDACGVGFVANMHGERSTMVSLICYLKSLDLFPRSICILI
ncbi:unnamed protein product [Rodentolepis nana]|uniref:Glutamine amidotransferase type-2 domain-containing protein n=1 Tax=Rodentolepis nana TaxID=102285 RepID=A0A0R3TC10_RODNA|nr:unnamed protein product [Rodentolepis nana]